MCSMFWYKISHWCFLSRSGELSGFQHSSFFFFFRGVGFCVASPERATIIIIKKKSYAKFFDASPANCCCWFSWEKAVVLSQSMKTQLAQWGNKKNHTSISPELKRTWGVLWLPSRTHASTAVYLFHCRCQQRDDTDAIGANQQTRQECEATTGRSRFGSLRQSGGVVGNVRRKHGPGSDWRTRVTAIAVSIKRNTDRNGEPPQTASVALCVCAHRPCRQGVCELRAVAMGIKQGGERGRSRGWTMCQS